MITANNTWTQLAKVWGSNAPAPLVIVLTIAGYNRVFTNYARGTVGGAFLYAAFESTAFYDTGSFPSNYYPWISKDSTSTLRQTVRDMSGGSDASTMEITVLDYQSAITNDYIAGTVLDGRKATIQVGFPTLDLADYVTIATLYVDHVDYDKDLTAYRFVLRDQSLLTQNYTFTVANDGFPTSTNHPYEVIDTPANLITAALEGAGLPVANINTSALSTVASQYWSGLKMDFKITYPPQAKSWVEQEIMEPLAAYWYWNNLGQWTPFVMYPLTAPTGVLTLNASNISKDTFPVPKESQDYTSAVTFRLDGDPNGQNFRTIIVDVYANAANIYGIQQSKVIQARGLSSTNGGVRYAELTIANIFQRYGLKPLTLSVKGLLSALLLDLSDKVSVTHSLLPTRAQGLYEVIGKSINFNEGTIELNLLNVNWQNVGADPNKVYTVAPNLTPPYTSRHDNSYMYISGSTGLYSNSDLGRNIY